ncbi:MAG: TIGR04100 family radical SAM protein [Ruminococcus sp.]|nr:TIGR04100 family radical SAM protein [Ruminococcus sp.]
MKKAMTISYAIGEKLYLNLTNQCPCACTFCIRSMSDGAYGSDPLWLEHEPTMEEIIADLEARDLAAYTEIVFCGFGEPIMRLDAMLETAAYLKAHGAKSIRLNTNGLADLVYGKPTAAALEGKIDTVSISLNAGTQEAYLAVTRPKFGVPAFAAMQQYALDCKRYVSQVMLTVVDVLEPEQMQAAKALSQRLDIQLRVRTFDQAEIRR